MKKHLEVVAAIIKHQHEFLAVQRNASVYDYASYKWEFPGGKVEQGETLESAIKRELMEELALPAVSPQLFTSVNHEYPDFTITMHCFIVDIENKQIELKEHIAKRWLKKEELLNLDWAAADVPVVEQLMAV